MYWGFNFTNTSNQQQKAINNPKPCPKEALYSPKHGGGSNPPQSLPTGEHPLKAVRIVRNLSHLQNAFCLVKKKATENHYQKHLTMKTVNESNQTPLEATKKLGFWTFLTKKVKPKKTTSMQQGPNNTQKNATSHKTHHTKTTNTKKYQRHSNITTNTKKHIKKPQNNARE